MDQFRTNSDIFTRPPSTDNRIRQLPVNNSAPPRITSINPTENTVPMIILDNPNPIYWAASIATVVAIWAPNPTYAPASSPSISNLLDSISVLFIPLV